MKKKAKQSFKYPKDNFIYIRNIYKKIVLNYNFNY